jgi:5-methylcytosine-specific restriction endonuclease McrA
MPARAPQHRPYAVASKTHEAKQESRQKKRALHTGSKAWRTLRAHVLAEELYVCRECGRQGDHVDHINGFISRCQNWSRGVSLKDVMDGQG